ncbi:MAG TPA: hypothetical protein VNU97_05820 [Rhizomicrobium sp.]|jgi:hypothetical protein|nr:hypothetical protein [Rhizomicrobium sp.]
MLRQFGKFGTKKLRMHRGQETLPAAPQAKDEMRVTVISTASELRAEQAQSEKQRLLEKRRANSRKAEAKRHRLVQGKAGKK